MSGDRVVELRHPETFVDDPLTAVLRSGARRLLAQAIEIAVSGFLAAHAALKDDLGRQRIVRHGHHRERQVQTGIGPVAVRCPRGRDRGPTGEAGKIRFSMKSSSHLARQATWHCSKSRIDKRLSLWLSAINEKTTISSSGRAKFPTPAGI